MQFNERTLHQMLPKEHDASMKPAQVAEVAEAPMVVEIIVVIEAEEADVVVEMDEEVEEDVVVKHEVDQMLGSYNLPMVNE